MVANHCQVDKLKLCGEPDCAGHGADIHSQAASSRLCHCGNWASAPFDAPA